MSWKSTVMDNIQLQNMKRNGNDGAAHVDPELVPEGHEDGQNIPTERHGLLSMQQQTTTGNGQTTACFHQLEAQRKTKPQKSTVCRIKDQLNEKVGVFRLWMILIFIFLIIIFVIVISLILCAVVHEDVDEKFDSSLFNVSQYFNGTFRLPNQIFTQDFLSLSSNKSKEVAAELQQKLCDLYTNSAALGRYFSTADIYNFRNGSVVAEYMLRFVLPADQQDQLRHFTLSREMVYNVFRQSLYEQEVDQTELTYVDPDSLRMF